jgi:hypothetical protein
VQALAQATLSESTAYQVTLGLIDLKKHIDFIASEEPGRPGLKREVLRMRIVGEFNQALHDLLEAFLTNCRSQLSGVFVQSELFTRDSPLVCLLLRFWHRCHEWHAAGSEQVSL